MADPLNCLFEQIGGAETCRRISERFHERIEADEVLRPLFPRDLETTVERFALFLTERLGGPADYTAKRGKTSLGCRHAHLSIASAEVERWLGHMFAALDELGISGAARDRLKSYFSETAPTLSDPLLPYYRLGLEELAEAIEAEPALIGISDSGTSLLARASREWDVERVRLLLELGADPNSVDSGGHDALYRAANGFIMGREVAGREVVRLLLRYGAKVNHVSGPKRTTALHMAARRGTLSIAEVLIAAGADLEAKDSKGVTPLGRAINCRKRDMVCYLGRFE